jgi:hypothetical protein
MSDFSARDRQLIVDYMRAMRNEIAVDIHAMEISGFNPACFGKFPRPSRWIGKARKFAFLSRLLHRISLPIWYFIGPLVFGLQCKAMRTQSRSAGSFSFDDAGQVLGFSIRAVDIVHSRHLHPIPKQWLELPWLPLSNLPTSAEVLSVTALLNEADIERSLALASLAHRTIQRRRGISEWGLQTFTAWRWFLVRLAVDKLPGPLLTVEHFDRWAVLVDSSVRRNHKPPRSLTVMQHGSVNALNSPRGLGLRLPTRLSSVSHIRVYSAADADVFKEEILSSRCDSDKLAVSFYNPCVTLSDVVTNGGSPSILFVGHPLCENAHCALLQALLEAGVSQLFYKPHPANPASSQIRDLPWSVVEGRSVFPRVDLLISYPSTVVREYAAHEIPAVVHPFDVSAAQLLERLPEVIEIIQAGHSTT